MRACKRAFLDNALVDFLFINYYVPIKLNSRLYINYTMYNYEAN